MWVAQALVYGLVIPWGWALSLPAPFWSEAAAIPLRRSAVLFCWGVLLGIGGVAYGLTLTRLGASFAYSFVFGVTALTGALLPLWVGSVDAPERGTPFAAGMLLVLLAIAGVGVACRRPKERVLHHARMVSSVWPLGKQS